MFRIPANSKRVFLGACVAVALLVANGAHATSFQMLYAFKGYPKDGSSPSAGLMVDSAGNLYGTTSAGGKTGDGTVFKLAPDGTETVLYAFKGGQDGSDPSGGLIADETGNLFGTTYDGGSSGPCGFSGPLGCGLVFKVSPAGKEKVLYIFVGGNDGEHPSGPVANHAADFYGTTLRGGAARFGTVFKLSRQGTETVLYSFKGGNDGSEPVAGLIADHAGNLYGTTNFGGGTGCGGIGCGTVFKVASDGTETVLYAFKGGHDGFDPFAGLILRNGTLLGTTSAGGGAQCGGTGCGTVFSLSLNGSEKVLYAFEGGSDGSTPVAGLIADRAGNLYGTTNYGGGAGCGGGGCGTVFALSPDGTETVLHAFKGSGHDGYYPMTSLILNAGYLIGTTLTGGFNYNGIVFRIKK